MQVNAFIPEKLFILKSTTNGDDEAFIYDKDFEEKIRKILTRISSDIDSAEAQSINSELVNSFEIYRLGIIRALLSNLHFLHYTAGLKDQFKELFESVGEFIKENNYNYIILLQELELFSESKLKVTESFIVYLLETLDLTDIQTKEIFINPEYTERFKFIFFKSKSDSKKNLKELIEYFFYLSSNKPYLSNYIDSLITEFIKTGKAGFDVSFKKIYYQDTGNVEIPYYGVKLLASFGDVLSSWLFDWQDKKPVFKLIEPIIRAIPNISQRYRDKTILKLVDEWGYNENIFNKIRETLRFQQIVNDSYFFQFDRIGSKLNVKFRLNEEDSELQKKIVILKRSIADRNYKETVSIINRASPDLLFFTLMCPDQRFCKNIIPFIIEWANKANWHRKRNFRELNKFTNLVFNYQSFQQFPTIIKSNLVCARAFKHYLGLIINDKNECNFDKIAILCTPGTVKHVKHILNTQNGSHPNRPTL